MYVVICKIDHCIHIHWCIVMGLGHNDPWVGSHMWPQQTWGQRSCRGQWPLVQVFGKKDQCIHILWCIFKSNITMIAKVCAHESRRDSWFENRLVCSESFHTCWHKTGVATLLANHTGGVIEAWSFWESFLMIHWWKYFGVICEHQDKSGFYIRQVFLWSCRMKKGWNLRHMRYTAVNLHLPMLTLHHLETLLVSSL